MATRRTFRPAAAIVAAAAPLLILTGCSSTDSSPAADSAAAQQQDRLVVTDQWVKAAPEGMTALFATLTNPGDSEVRVVSGTSPAAGKVELHEMAVSGGENVMREKKDGFVIPGRGTLTLAPGGDHIMLMDLKGPINAGQTVEVDLRMADGSTQKVRAMARDFAGNQENYQP
ncbi:hypothetical protein GOHSU_38_00470 [Gordonia hirsuta DSM 44140 = NBRC 16056]|uniref:Copper chaperone PCu(A)C n=1 Tax=Gordonia hirsuta DSM 44140 = NBRC 16056 TaxID=1121927 RepID=L7LEC5_9ACTN|nr:copper chaperone PCu(A)C [Gordonia hirsuta]GAC58408.1 hypothetical protein GOHSU_38_00470 [Gordonia hirsuta DSM 44140 = NBRC 16056]